MITEHWDGEDDDSDNESDQFKIFEKYLRDEDFDAYESL